jgi:adenosylmethionine-8-amino-7-oxononanoate aminotransferase
MVRSLSFGYLVFPGFASLCPGYACYMPPYVITPEEIDFLAQVAREGIEHAVA